MIDLNDLRVFAGVASLRSFSAAARALGLPKSSVSRSVARLEVELGVRLFQRTTREVGLTEFGVILKGRCADILARVDDTIECVGSLAAGQPRGKLRISSGIGFGINVLSELLPVFMERHPAIDVALDLTSHLVDLVAESVDVAIRIGPMPDSQLVARRLGAMHRYLCAAPSYLARRGAPGTLEDLCNHDVIEMPGIDGRPRQWSFSSSAGEIVTLGLSPRLSVNEALTICRLIVNGAGIGCVSAYLCAPEFEAGRLVRLFPEWMLPAMEISVVFPSNREMSPSIRAFVDFLKEASAPGTSWQADPLPAGATANDREG